jgi:tRNA pseudouridine65 synthase
LVLFALDPEAARAFQEALAAEDAVKQYFALVRGAPPAEFRSDRPLTRGSDGLVQPASTAFRTLGAARGFALVEARPATGRRHQVRRHLDHLGHQVVGDTTHGKGRINRWLREEYALPRLFLHAARLVLRHPFTGERRAIADPLPADLAHFLERFAPELLAALPVD